MTQLKKAIRARARKTGERYTAARRQVLLAREKRGGAPAQLTTAAPPSPAPSPRAAAASRLTRGIVGDAAVLKKTGHGFDHWFAVLDAFGAPAKGHTAAARHLYEAHGVPGWHAQGITVAYERTRGLRATNQASTGKSRCRSRRRCPRRWPRWRAPSARPGSALGGCAARIRASPALSPPLSPVPSPGS